MFSAALDGGAGYAPPDPPALVLVCSGADFGTVFETYGHRFVIDFGSVLASNMDPSWGPRRLKIRKLGPKKLSRSSIRRVLDMSLLFERVLDRLGLDFGGVRGRFSYVFG